MRRRQRPDWRWPGLRAVFAVSLGGLRGAIALAGILSLPRLMPDGAPFPARELLIEVVVGVVLCSLLIGAIALPPVLRGLHAAPDAAPKRARRLALVAAARAARRAVEARRVELEAASSAREAALCRKAASAVVERYQRIIDRGAGAMAANEPGGGALSDAELAATYATELRLVGLQAARDELHDAKASGLIDEEAVKSLSAELDLTELALRGARRS